MAIDGPLIGDILRPFLQKVTLRDRLRPDEVAAIMGAAAEVVEIKAGEDLVVVGQRPTTSMLVARGFTCRYRILPEGTRQLMALHIPGDFVDLHSFLLKEMDHSVGALTSCLVVVFPHDRLRRLTEEHPHLARLLWLLTLLDSAIHREWLVGMGRRSALQRTAHLICETYTRLHVIDLARDNSFDLPITQSALADAVGISTVHINRVLQELRQDALITWDGGLMKIGDWDRLASLAEFDPRYLHLVQEQR